MLNKKSTFIQNINNRKGQVALFIALAFQILFLFFAMVINVGLLVHHKINLQNSVDLAAYYGAMKQAENMNAIAHINYQIRQSWKLLSWRYRMLGTAGEFEAHPYRKLGSPKQVDAAMAVEALSSNPNYRYWQEQPAFCVTYIPFKPMPPGENTCKAIANMTPTRLWSAPPLIASHQIFSGTIRRTSEALRINAINRCKYFGSYNFVMLAKFAVAFNTDQRDRLELISLLSRGTSYKQDDFYDLDGESVRTGIEKTLMNNLTSANRASLVDDKSGGLEIFNSLGADGCNAQGVAEGQPAKWLQPIRIVPGFSYVDTVCDAGNAISPRRAQLSKNDWPRHKAEVPELSDVIDLLSDYVGSRVQNINDNYNFSIGVEKNPWCMAYVGVSAATKPKIPFSPFGTVTLKARAFYKPFGGRMGPWYYKAWNRGSPGSEGSLNDRTDLNLPPRVTDPSQFATVAESQENDSLRVANYSRFIGDTLGLKSLKMMGHYGKAIYDLDSGWRGGTAPTTGDSIYDNGDAPNFAHWDDLPFKYIENGQSGDIMAWDHRLDRPSPMRVLETAAILPDNFDIAYYSIEPDFYHNYYLRIKNGYLAGPGRGFLRTVRPDLGYRKVPKMGPYDFEKFSIKDQYNTVKDPTDVVNIAETVNKEFTYVTENWMHTLTSWAPKNLMDYSLDTTKLGKCQTLPAGAEDNDPKPPTAGNCVYGGTTGYSVKMVSGDYLRSSDLKLGGENAGSGPLLNPPPDESEF